MTQPVATSIDELWNAIRKLFTGGATITGATLLKPRILMATSTPASGTTLRPNAGVVFFDTTSAAQSVTMPKAAGAAGQMVTLINTGDTGRLLTINRQGTDTVANVASITLAAQGSITLVADGTSKWWIVSTN